jgi:hypothetical protein
MIIFYLFIVNITHIIIFSFSFRVLNFVDLMFSIRSPEIDSPPQKMECRDSERMDHNGIYREVYPLCRQRCSYAQFSNLDWVSCKSTIFLETCVAHYTLRRKTIQALEDIHDHFKCIPTYSNVREWMFYLLIVNLGKVPYPWIRLGLIASFCRVSQDLSNDV